MTAPNELSFLPDDYLEQKHKRRAHLICAVLVVLNAGGLVAGWTTMSGRHAHVESQFNEVTANYVDAARKIEQVKKMHEQQREVVHHAELAASLVEKVPRSNILAEITNALPAGVSLLELSMKSAPHHDNTPAPTSSFEQHKAAIQAQHDNQDALGLGAKPQQFDVTLNITGIARDDVQVAQLISRLSHSKLFQDVNLVISDTYLPPASDPNDKPDALRRWQIEMMLNPQAEVRDETKTAAVELSN